MVIDMGSSPRLKLAQLAGLLLEVRGAPCLQSNGSFHTWNVYENFHLHNPTDTLFEMYYWEFLFLTM